MIIKHVREVDGEFFEREIQKIVNEVLNEAVCHRKLVDIKYSTTIFHNAGVQYSALLIFE